MKDAVYESRLVYSIDTLPPFYGKAKASVDFQKMFYSIDVFEDWKKVSGNTSLEFDDFSKAEIVNGFVLSKREKEQLAILVFKKNDNSFVLIRTNQLPVLDDFFRYANHISKILKIEYVLRAKDELNIIETRFKDFSTANDAIIFQLLAVDRFIVAANKGAAIFSIQRPTLPKKVSPKPLLTLGVSVISGGMIGVLFVLVSNAVRKRRERLAKA